MGDVSALNGEQYLIIISFRSKGNLLIYSEILNIFPLLNCFFNSKWDSTANQIWTCFSFEWGITSNQYFLHIKIQFFDFHMILHTSPPFHCFFNSKSDSTANHIRTCFRLEWGTTSKHYFIHITGQLLDFHIILHTSSPLHCFFQFKVR